MEKEVEKSKSRQATRLATLLLDSSLITQTKRVPYNIKIIECGDYVQVYSSEVKFKSDNSLEELDELNLYKKKIELEENIKTERKVGEVQYKNLLRSRFQMERLIKTNEHIWKTFITLTFAENLKDIKYANKKFNIWRTYIKRLKKDFSYVCVPEYQKRGAVHYHLLTNLDISKDLNIIIPQCGKNGKVLKNRYDVKGWSYGFTRVDELKDLNVISYLSKYMTKESDNRLYGYRKYLNSTNLKQPHTSYLDLTEIKHYEHLEKMLKNKELDYSNKYFDYYGDEVNFFEFKGSQHNMYYTKTLFYTKYGFYSI